MEPQSIFDLSAQEFEGAIAELGLPQSEADQLRRQYRRQNSPFSGLYGLLDSVRGQDAEQGRVRADVLPLTRPEGMTGMEALLAGEAQLALPGGLLGAAEGAAMGIDAPGSAYQGMIPLEDMAGEALGTAGMAMLGGGAVARPAGSVGMGGRVYHGGPERITAPEARQDPEGLLPGFSVARTPDVAEMYARQRGGGFVSEFEIDPQRLNSIGEMEYYDILNELEDRFGFDEGEVPDAVALQELRDRGINAISYPEEEFGIRILDPSILRPISGDLLSANRSTTTGAVGLLANESRAQQIARMLREGRGDEITEDMLAALDANDNMELADLYASGATGMDMPMDYESRMARAAEMGLLDDQYHATTVDFPAFLPSQTGLAGRGVYTGDSATDVLDYARVDGDDGLNVIPVRTPPTGDYARRIDWQNLIDTDPEFPWNATVDETVAGFSRAADTMSGWGHAGVHSQPGERVTFYPRNIRSRFARFDPRLRNSANLLAANASPELGLLAASAPSEQEQLDQLRTYLGLLAQ